MKPTGRLCIYYLLIMQITKKLAGNIGQTAAWMTNFENEDSDIRNRVPITGGGAGFEEA